MTHAFLSAFSVFVSLVWFYSQTAEGAKVWSGKPHVTAVQGDSTTLEWSVTLTDHDVNKPWAYIKILHAEGAYTEELVTYKKTREKVIDNRSYKNRKSDMTFDVSQSGSTMTIRFTLANLNRTTDMKNYKAMLGFSNDASTYPGLTVLTILVKPHSTEFKIYPEKNAFCLEDKVNLTCKADGIPPAQTSLFLNNKLVQSGNTSLTLSALSLNVKGENNFVCVPNNTAGVGKTRNVKLVVKEPPKIARCVINGEEVTSKSVIEGTKVTILCHVTGSEALYITWHKENVQKTLSQSNTLTFGSINRKDSGQYRMTVYSGKECETTVAKILLLTVMYLDKPVVQGKAYKVVNPENPDQAAHFKITVDGNPHPSITCRREGTPGNVSITGAVSGSISTFSIKIYINSHFVGDEGYVCNLRSKAGTRYMKFHLYKGGPPISVKGTLTLTNVSWTEDLNRAKSASYILMKMRVEQALKQVYRSEEFVSRVQIIGFVKGSVAVNFELHIIANVTDPILLLKKAVENNGGQLNGLMINTASIKRGYSVAKEDGERAGRSESDDELKLGLGLGLGLLALLLLVLGLVVYCFCCRRKGGGDECPVEGVDKSPGSIHAALTGPLHFRPKSKNDRKVIFERTHEFKPDGTKKTTERMIIDAERFDKGSRELFEVGFGTNTDRYLTYGNDRSAPS